MTDDTERAAARKRLEAKQEFFNHLVAYVLVNAALIGIWAFSGGGHFWPMWVLLGWGIGVLFNAWAVFVQKPITEEDVDRELHQHHM
jgi:hypothetical protein